MDIHIQMKMGISSLSWILSQSTSTPTPTLTEQITKRLLEIPAIGLSVAIFGILLGVVVAIAKFTGSLDKILDFLEKRLLKRKVLISVKAFIINAMSVYILMTHQQTLQPLTMGRLFSYQELSGLLLSICPHGEALLTANELICAKHCFSHKVSIR